MREALVAECEAEEDSCLYTSATFYIWLRWLKTVRAILWGVGGVGSLVAASHILKGDTEGNKIAIAGAALAGVAFPALVRILQLDVAIRDYRDAAAKFKILQGEFRRLSHVWSQKEFSDFEKEARRAFGAMNDARKPSLTPPELCFRLARWKIKKGDYAPDK